MTCTFAILSNQKGDEQYYSVFYSDVTSICRPPHENNVPAPPGNPMKSYEVANLRYDTCTFVTYTQFVLLCSGHATENKRRKRRLRQRTSVPILAKNTCGRDR